MNKQQVIELFKESILPGIEEVEANQPKGTGKDKPYRRQSWHDFVDGLNKEGEVTDRQANTWTVPKICL